MSEAHELRGRQWPVGRFVVGCLLLHAALLGWGAWRHSVTKYLQGERFRESLGEMLEL